VAEQTICNTIIDNKADITLQSVLFIF